MVRIDSRIAYLDKEKREWLDITNFNVWQVLKLVNGRKSHIRKMIGVFQGSSTTIENTVNNLVRWRLLSENRSQAWPFKRTLALTEEGVEMLDLLDKIGEKVKQIRKDMEKKEVRKDGADKGEG